MTDIDSTINNLIQEWDSDDYHCEGQKNASLHVRLYLLVEQTKQAQKVEDAEKANRKLRGITEYCQGYNKCSDDIAKAIRGNDE